MSGQSARDSLVRFQTSLGQLGYEHGLLLDGFKGARSVFFELPLEGVARDGSIMLSARFAESVLGESTLTVLVNDKPRRALLSRMGADSGVVTARVPLTPAELKQEFVKLGIRYSLLRDRDICVNQQLGEAFATVLPESRLEFSVPASVLRTVAGAWRLLPRQVRIGLPARALNPDEYAAAYMLAVSLLRRGLEPTFVPLSDSVSIIIGTRAEVERGTLRALAAQSADSARFGGDIMLVQRATQGHDSAGVIAVVANHRASAMRLLGRLWEESGGGSRVEVQYGDNVLSSASVVTLRDLGMEDEERIFAEEATWSIPLRLRDMPSGRLPTRLRLDLVSSRTETEGILLLHLYLNGTLLETRRLESKGLRQTFRYTLPEFLLRSENEVRVVAQREEEGGACDAPQAAYPLQLLSTSRVYIEKQSNRPLGFRDLALRLNAGPVVYLARDIAAEPARVLGFLLYLSRGFWPDDIVPEIHMYNGGDLQPTGPFVLLSRDPPPKLQAPLRLGKERVTLRAVAGGRPLFDLSQLDRWTIIQVAQLGEQSGLWIAPAAQQPQLAMVPVSLGDENVTLLDESGQAYRFGANDDVFAINYADRSGFVESMSRYRWPLFALAWLVATVLILYVAMLTRRHRRK